MRDNVYIYQAIKGDKKVVGTLQEVSTAINVHKNYICSTMYKDINPHGWEITRIAIYHKYYQAKINDEVVAKGTMRDIAKALHYGYESCRNAVKGNRLIGKSIKIERIADETEQCWHIPSL